jgi:hypothetical protein
MYIYIYVYIYIYIYIYIYTYINVLTSVAPSVQPLRSLLASPSPCQPTIIAMAASGAAAAAAAAEAVGNLTLAALSIVFDRAATEAAEAAAASKLTLAALSVDFGRAAAEPARMAWVAAQAAADAAARAAAEARRLRQAVVEAAAANGTAMCGVCGTGMCDSATRCCQQPLCDSYFRGGDGRCPLCPVEFMPPMDFFGQCQPCPKRPRHGYPGAAPGTP